MRKVGVTLVAGEKKDGNCVSVVAEWVGKKHDVVCEKVVILSVRWVYYVYRRLYDVAYVL